MKKTKTKTKQKQKAKTKNKTIREQFQNAFDKS